MSEPTLLEPAVTTVEPTPDRPRRPRWWRYAAAGVALVLVGAGGVVWWERHGDLPDDAVLSVHGRVVSQDDYRARLATVKALYGVDAPTDASRLEQFRQDTAQSVAVGLVIDDAAADRGVSISDDAAETALTAYISSFYGKGDAGRTAFDQALTESGTSRTAVLDEVRRQLLVTKLFGDVTASVATPSADAVRAYYDDHACAYDLPEQRKIRNIVVATKAEATRLRARLDDGASFAALARTTSLDTSTSASGGNLGVLTRSQVEKAYGAAAFGVRSGALFGPVRSSYGWNVGQVIATRAAHRATFDQARDAAARALLDQQRTEVWQSWLRSQITAADVRYAASYQPADPDALPSTDAVASPSSGASDGATTTTTGTC